MMVKIDWKDIPRYYQDFLVNERDYEPNGWLIVDSNGKAIYYEPSMEDELNMAIRRGWLYADIFPLELTEKETKYFLRKGAILGEYIYI